MRHVTNSINYLIAFIIWLLCVNSLEACNLNVKIIYTQADLQTIIDITPQLFDRGFIKFSLDSLTVESDKESLKLFKAINSLKKTNDIHSSIDVRAKIIFYLNKKVYDTFYLGMFYMYHQNKLYEINEEFRRKVNTIIKRREKLPMYL